MTKPSRIRRNEKRRERRWRTSNALLAELRERQPETFDPKSPRLVKIGIHRDFMQVFPEYKKDEIWAFFHWWTGRYKYREALKRGKSAELPRYDLWGNRYPFEPDV